MEGDLGTAGRDQPVLDARLSHDRRTLDILAALDSPHRGSETTLGDPR
jgi:hypothetical protein